MSWWCFTKWPCPCVVHVLMYCFCALRCCFCFLWVRMFDFPIVWFLLHIPLFLSLGSLLLFWLLLVHGRVAFCCPLFFYGWLAAFVCFCVSCFRVVVVFHASALQVLGFAAVQRQQEQREKHAHCSSTKSLKIEDDNHHKCCTLPAFPRAVGEGHMMGRPVFEYNWQLRNWKVRAIDQMNNKSPIRRQCGSRVSTANLVEPPPKAMGCGACPLYCISSTKHAKSVLHFQHSSFMACLSSCISVRTTSCCITVLNFQLHLLCWVMYTCRCECVFVGIVLRGSGWLCPALGWNQGSRPMPPAWRGFTWFINALCQTVFLIIIDTGCHCSHVFICLVFL